MKFFRASKRQELLVENVTAYKAFFNTEEGKKVFNDLLKRVGYFTTTCHDNSNIMYYKQGRKDVITDIINICDQDPAKLLEHFRKSMKEQQEYEEDFE